VLPGLVLDAALGAIETRNVVRWPLLIGAAVLASLWLGFRARADLAEAMGFEDADVALLTVGSIAAPVLNVPVWIVSDAVFAMNLGGALVPFVIAWRLYARGVLPVPRTVLAAMPVAAAAWFVVEVEPARGVVAPFPEFLAPPLVALVAGLVLSAGKLEQAGPIALVAGSLGALVGADGTALPAIVAAASEASAGTAFVVGGGGAFDLVFLSGALGMAASLGIAAFAVEAPEPGIGQRRAPLRVPDARGLLDDLDGRPGLSPRERCLVAIAKANLALATGRRAQAVEQARAGTDALLGAGQPRLIDRVRSGDSADGLTGELQALDEATRVEDPSWVEAADAVEHAKQVAGRLFEHAIGRVRARGWQR